MSRRQEMMRKVQQMDFLIVEVGLYLNNHPDNQAALSFFAKYKELAAQARREYEGEFGPLTYSSVDVDKDGWSWINMPWPWEVEA